MRKKARPFLLRVEKPVYETFAQPANPRRKMLALPCHGRTPATAGALQRRIRPGALSPAPRRAAAAFRRPRRRRAEAHRPAVSRRGVDVHAVLVRRFHRRAMPGG